MSNNIAVVFCTWSRIDRLEKTLKNLLSQSYKSFDVFIWNNNHVEKNRINSIISKYKNIKINVHHSSTNIGGIGRFYYSKKISTDYSKIIFIDDDQLLGNHVIENMIKKYKDLSITSWWGFQLNNSYWDRKRITDYQQVDYCGTGGMIIDSSIFKDINLDEIPDEYKFIEDLWLSFVAKYKYNYELFGGDFDIKIEVDGKDQYTKLKKKKGEFYNYLSKKFKK